MDDGLVARQTDGTTEKTQKNREKEGRGKGGGGGGSDCYSVRFYKINITTYTTTVGNSDF